MKKICLYFIMLFFSVGVFAAENKEVKLILLGTKGGPSLLSSEVLPQSTALVVGQDVYLIDAGYGASYRLLEAGIKLKDIKGIFITHMHSDHILDYPSLIMNSWLSGLKHPVQIFGPQGIKNSTDDIYSAFKRDIQLRIEDEGRADIRSLMKLNEYRQGQVYQDDNISVTALAVPHSPFEMGEAYAFRFQVGDKVIVFSGDMNFNKPFIKFAKNADILVSEVVHLEGVKGLAQRMGYGQKFIDAVISHHITTQDVGKTAQQAKVKHLVLSHLVPAEDKTLTDAKWKSEISPFYSGKITVGKDGMSFQVQ